MNLADSISPRFHSLVWDILEHRHTFYWLPGGRGSTKSSFISMMIPILLYQNPNAHCVVLRKVGNTIKNSVFAQMQWAIDQLGIQDDVRYTISPPSITIKSTNQRVLFLGVDHPEKIKSIKPPFGYIGIVWYEEADQYAGMAEMRSINQSLLRGGTDYWVFASYNPPKSRDNWVNAEVLLDYDDRLVYRSTYLDVPREWLGEQFFMDAEKLKEKNEQAYRHEYLGEVTGTGGSVFDNVEDVRLTDEQIAAFDKLYFGIDYGFAVDPLAFVAVYYDAKREDLYIFSEIYQQKLSNSRAVALIKPIAGNHKITADSAEPKSIAEMKALGLRVDGAKKGADSVEYGIKWLQERRHIYIDKHRCPNTYQEFIGYEYELNREGKFISSYPDKNNHAIDSVRYSIESLTRQSNFRF